MMLQFAGAMGVFLMLVFAGFLVNDFFDSKERFLLLKRIIVISFLPIIIMLLVNISLLTNEQMLILKIVLLAFIGGLLLYFLLGTSNVNNNIIQEYSKHKKSAITIAKENDLKYLKNITFKMNFKNGFLNIISLKDGYVALKPTCKDSKWFHRMDNKIICLFDTSLENGITNIDEILIELIDIYMKYYDTSTNINIYNFNIKLVEPMSQKYKGKGQLTISDSSISSRYFSINEVEEFVKSFNLANDSLNLKLKELKNLDDVEELAEILALLKLHPLY